MGRWHALLSFTKRAARHPGNLTSLKCGNREFTEKSGSGIFYISQNMS